MEYRKTYQTWTISRSNNKTLPSEGLQQTHNSQEKLRHRLQKMRIEKRWSINNLAEAVACDVESIAAYERGDELLSADVLKTMERILSAE